MTKPRYIVPGSILLVTRRAHRRVFALRPDKQVNQLILYLLAVGVKKYGLHLHGYVFMSNHFHLLVTDVRGNFPKFAQWFDSLLARALNALHGTRDSIFSPTDRLHVAIVTDAAAVEDRIGYIAANPVADGAVELGRDWPGLRSNANHYYRPQIVGRPKFFFGEKSRMPGRATLQLTVPSTHDDLSPGDFAQVAARAIGAAEAAARARRAAEGLGYAGVAACRATSPERSAKRPEPLKESKPRDFVSRDPSAEAWMQSILDGFQEAYSAARSRWLSGNRAVLWPHGTWQMRVLHGVAVSQIPPPAMVA